MSTQYDKVQKPYDKWRESSIGRVERVNIREVVSPFIKDAKVLDLACGSGFYSRACLKWGASRVLGVDISSGMIQEAQALGQGDDAISYQVADCSTPKEFPGGPFDLVFGGWFLNYSNNVYDMAEMFKMISVNLKPGGRFVGITPVPTNDPAVHIAKEGRWRPLPTASGTMFSKVTGTIRDGVEVNRSADTSAGRLSFDTYHLRKEVFEEAAKQAGFERSVKWGITSVPFDFMSNPDKHGEDDNGGASVGELNTYDEVPFYGIISLMK